MFKGCPVKGEVHNTSFVALLTENLVCLASISYGALNCIEMGFIIADRMEDKKREEKEKVEAAKSKKKAKKKEKETAHKIRMEMESKGGIQREKGVQRVYPSEEEIRDRIHKATKDAVEEATKHLRDELKTGRVLSGAPPVAKRKFSDCKLFSSLSLYWVTTLITVQGVDNAGVLFRLLPGG
jgi:cell division protein FtsI/penicillin-binding protein 2